MKQEVRRLSRIALGQLILFSKSKDAISVSPRRGLYRVWSASFGSPSV